MAEDVEFKIKGAADQQHQAKETKLDIGEEGQASDQPSSKHPVQEATALDQKEPSDATAAQEDPGQKDPSEEAPTQADSSPQESTAANYRWCKCFLPPEQVTTQEYYFMHFDTQETKWEEPTEPYWIWDAMTGTVHPTGLHYPATTLRPNLTSTAQAAPSSEQNTEYQGYNPKIHGSYDPNAPYAQYHNQKRAEEQAIAEYGSVAAATQAADYAAVGAFNRFSGGFQTADKSAERHNDYNKSGRQMNAFFDVDAAANSHDGKSLKEERRQQKLSKKEIAELAKKRKEKKEKKRLDFYKS